MVVNDIAAAGTIATRSQMNFPSKVKRYWPGKAPEWLHDAGAAADDDDNVSFEAALGRGGFLEQQKVTVKECAPLKETDTHAVKLSDDYYRERQLDDGEDDASEIEELEARRKRVKERQLPFLEQQEDLLLREGVMEVDMEPEYVTDSDSDDEQITPVVLTPTPISFIPKSQRETIAERQSLEEEQQRLEELAKKRLEHRNHETRRIVVELIRGEELHQEPDDHTTLNEADCDDELNESVELEAWKRRELARMKRDREGKTKNMANILTDEERRKRGVGDPTNDPLALPNKNKRKFLQKYYHKGCFFQDNPDDARQTTGTSSIFGRAFSAPTGEDKVDKAALPKVMQVRNFGRRGRSKWTHLVDEDTTYRGSRFCCVRSIPV